MFPWARQGGEGSRGRGDAYINHIKQHHKHTDKNKTLTSYLEKTFFRRKK